MAETGSSEVDLVRAWLDELMPEGVVWEESHDEILDEAINVLDLYVVTAGEMRCLLEEDGVAVIQLAHVDEYLSFLCSKNRVHEADVV